MSKFRVGDKVRVTKVKNVDRKKEFIGKEFTIRNYSEFRGLYDLKGENKWRWHEEELELVSNNIKEKQFTKSDLKTGMWVEYRNGDKRMAVIDSINGDVFVSSEGYICIKDYNNNLTIETYQRDLDVVKVFKPKTFCSMYRGDYLELIWQRSEEPKNKIEKTVIRTFTYNGETITVVHKENKTTVRLQDNTKGMARCHVEDTFNRDKGLEIAYLRAKERQIKSKISELVK